MSIERRVLELERGRPVDISPLVLLLAGTGASAEHRIAIEEAQRAGRQVIRVRFVNPEIAAKEQP